MTRPFRCREDEDGKGNGLKLELALRYSLEPRLLCKCRLLLSSYAFHTRRLSLFLPKLREKIEGFEKVVTHFSVGFFLKRGQATTLPIRRDNKATSVW